MYRMLVFSLCLVLFPVPMVVAQDNVSNGSDGSGDSGAKMVTGISIVGNEEAPKSLFIVPWKSSELGVETSLNRTLNEHDVPVDRDVFMRQLNFYEVSTAKID